MKKYLRAAIVAVGLTSMIAAPASATSYHSWGSCNWHATENPGAGTTLASEDSSSCNRVQARIYWITPTGTYTYLTCAEDPSFSSCGINSGTFLTGQSRGKALDKSPNYSSWIATT